MSKVSALPRLHWTRRVDGTVTTTLIRRDGTEVVYLWDAGRRLAEAL